MAIFAGIMIVYSITGSFSFDSFAKAVTSLSSGKLWALFALFAAGFGVKMALMPFHLWQAPAYSETPGASSAFLNAVSARMGLFALILVLIKVIGLNTLGGRSYLFRRESGTRLLVNYYSVLVIDRANREGINRHGIDLARILPLLTREIEATGQLIYRETYLDNLYDLLEKYPAPEPEQDWQEGREPDAHPKTKTIIQG